MYDHCQFEGKGPQVDCNNIWPVLHGMQEHSPGALADGSNGPLSDSILSVHINPAVGN